MSAKRTILSASVVCGLALLVFAGTSRKVHAAAAADDIDSGVRSVAEAYSLIEQNFADKVTPNRAFFEGAIPGMLSTLDPHSSFVEPLAYGEMQRKQRAQYFGVGMVIQLDRRAEGDVVVAFEPFTDAPAYRAGLRRGDVLMKIDETSAKGLDTQKVADLLRGPRGTQVHVTVRREGFPELLSFTVTRGEIQTSVVDGYWVKPGIAYLGLTSFEAQNITTDVERIMRTLGEKNVNGLLLDLRGNPGGLVTEAVNLAGRFLKDGQVVVSNRGRATPEQAHRARANALAQTYPIVVMVNRNSASASEIVSGALQDHDRAWILGDTTFGKGLVQAQFPLSEGAALLLTIAHYYTPSGRLIQRDYANHSFYEYITNRGGVPQQTEMKTTDQGRKVYGGGGISPDEKYETPKVTIFQRRMLSVGVNAFFRFGSIYFAGKVAKLPSAAWTPDDAVVQQFKDYLTREKVTFTDQEFEANKKWVADQIRIEMLTRAFDKNTGVRAVTLEDPELAKAVESLPKAQALISRRGPVQQANR